MFEDSTFESQGRICTRSRGWIMAAFCFNGSILLALILIPLIYPEALPSLIAIQALEAPVPPPQRVPPKPVQAQPTHEQSQMSDGHIMAPPRIPPQIRYFRAGDDDLPKGDFNSPSGFGDGVTGSGSSVFPGNRSAPLVKPESKGPVRLPSTIVSGLLIRKTVPVYPPIAKAAHVEGTVVLQATISAAGTIENLRVTAGPAMLRQAALDAVQSWRYRPYELNGEPVEVETTVNVIFSLGHN